MSESEPNRETSELTDAQKPFVVAAIQTKLGYQVFGKPQMQHGPTIIDGQSCWAVIPQSPKSILNPSRTKVEIVRDSGFVLTLKVSVKMFCPLRHSNGEDIKGISKTYHFPEFSVPYAQHPTPQPALGTFADPVDIAALERSLERREPVDRGLVIVTMGMVVLATTAILTTPELRQEISNSLWNIDIHATAKAIWQKIHELIP
ncbi:MAG: hypothetical protein O2904_02015 [bacterium]|nr:hypothetical protein [bacterium]